MIHNPSSMIIPFIKFIFLAIIALPTTVSATIWCYSCVSTQPGCGADGVDWWLHSAITCPKDNDMCVKIIEKKEGETRITRDCLSNLIGVKTNIPGDTFEGCRSAAPQPMLAVYVENHVNQFDLKREYWTNTTYCFCQLDHWCNSSHQNLPATLTMLASIFVYSMATI